MAQSELHTKDINSISERLKDVPLRLPRSLGEHPGADIKKTYLQDLLSRDAGVFLERHGRELDAHERSVFEPLRPGSFEVDHYMRQLEHSSANKDDGDAPGRADVRNRRLAKLNRLSADGFLSEAAIRARAPELADQYIGASTESDAAANSASQGDMLDRLENQVILQEKQNKAVRQQQALREQQEEEEEEEDKVKDEDDHAAGPVKEAAAQPSEEDIMAGQENEEVLVSIMRARFLSGEDTSVNYKDIDNDVSLDNDWALQADQDAQDKYFESDSA